jgi:hypothetical protein
MGVNGLNFSPDGEKLSSSSADGTVVMWGENRLFLGYLAAEFKNRVLPTRIKKSVFCMQGRPFHLEFH